MNAGLDLRLVDALLDEELVDRCIADQDGKKECEFKENGFITF